MLFNNITFIPDASKTHCAFQPVLVKPMLWNHIVFAKPYIGYYAGHRHDIPLVVCIIWLIQTEQKASYFTQIDKMHDDKFKLLEQG